MEIQNYTTVNATTHTSMGRIKKSENQEVVQDAQKLKPFQLFWCTGWSGHL